MGESGPDSSDYSYDLDEQDYQQDLGYTDPDAMTNTRYNNVYFRLRFNEVNSINTYLNSKFVLCLENF